MIDDLPTIVVCDDNRSRVRTWSAQIDAAPEVSGRFRIDPLEPEAFARAYAALKQRQLHFRAGSPMPTTDDAAVLDDAAMAVIDFDLTPTVGLADLDPETIATLSGSFGDNFAYLTRCFSRASYTVLVNQDFYQSTFDLSHERFANSNADLNVAHNDLGRAELWAGKSGGATFRPWSWPRLVDMPQRRTELQADLDLDAPVLETLGLADDDVYDQFDPAQLVLFDREPRSVTFRDSVDFTRRFRRLGKPEYTPEENLAKVAVASVSHWLERIVLPAQNVLVDAPHLAQRRAGLLVDSDPAAWAPLTDLSDPDGAVALFDAEKVAEAHAPAISKWLSRPAWLWSRCPRTPGRVLGDAVVFCEDVSAFRPLDDASEYKSSVPGPFKQRFVLHEDLDVSNGFAPEYWPVQSLFSDDD